MKKYLPIITIALFGVSCSHPNGSNESQTLKKDTIAKSTAKSANIVKSKTAKPDTAGDKYPGWVDTLVFSYTKHTNNELVKYSITHHLKEEWVLDDKEKTDTATYWIFNVGHDVSEPDGTETRYISDSRVYVDSVKRKLYQFDSTNERLVEWK